MHVKITNGQPETYTIGQMRRDNPNVSFPRNIPDSLLANYNVFPLVQTDRPVLDHTRIETPGTPVLVSGVWTQVWDVADATSDVIAQRTLEKSQSVRSERTQKLVDCDHLALSDNTMSAEWSAYRQALRNITDHANFPYLGDDDWPVEPA